MRRRTGNPAGSVSKGALRHRGLSPKGRCTATEPETLPGPVPKGTYIAEPEACGVCPQGGVTPPAAGGIAGPVPKGGIAPPNRKSCGACPQGGVAPPVAGHAAGV
ncbi:MAG: hypothetical protein LBE17_02985 [Treponema sp.]|nr:hypothetical protein [Treponema sp.]